MRAFDRGKGKSSQPDEGKNLAGQVEPAAFGFRAFVDSMRRKQQRRCTEGQAHIEDAAPTNAINEPATYCRTDDKSETITAGPNAQRVDTLFAVRVGQREQHQRHWQRKRRTYSADDTSTDQGYGVGRKRADQSPAREQHDTEQENAAATIKVSECPTGKQQTGVGQVVRIHDPLHLADTGTQIDRNAFEREVN